MLRAVEDSERLSFKAEYLARGRKNGRTDANVDPELDTEAWSDFVDSCEIGYDDVLAEYDYELQTRQFIEWALQDPRLQGNPEFVRFSEVVAETDERFRGLLGVDFPTEARNLPWWRREIPRFGGSVFVDDVRARLGLKIDLKDGA